MNGTAIFFLIVLAIIVGAVVYKLRGSESSTGSAAAEQPVAEIKSTPGRYDFDIVGEGHYQKALKRIAGPKSAGSKQLKRTAILIRENDNPHDPKAVAVTIEGELVGYLDREAARSFRQKLKGQVPAGVPVSCPAMIVGGWDRGGGDEGHYGVKLDLPSQEDG